MWRKAHYQRLYVKPMGVTLDLKCGAVGKPRPTIRWLKDGKRFSFRTNVKPVFKKYSLRLEELVKEGRAAAEEEKPPQDVESASTSSTTRLKTS